MDPCKGYTLVLTYTKLLMFIKSRNVSEKFCLCYVVLKKWPRQSAICFTISLKINLVENKEGNSHIVLLVAQSSFNN